MRDIRVATVQFQPAASDKSYNLGRINHFVAAAARAQAELIAFPEMCLTGTGTCASLRARSSRRWRSRFLTDRVRARSGSCRAIGG